MTRTISGESNQSAWDNIFKIKKENKSCNQHPIEHVVVFVAKNYYRVPKREDIRVLEIGSGTGCNLAFLSKAGFQTYGLDHSAFAVEMAKEFLEERQCLAEIVHSCATSIPFESSFFDVCVESNSIHCNSTEDIIKIFDEIYRVLKIGGKFFGIFVSDVTEEFGQGVPFDERTFDFTEVKNASRGQFDGFPVIHFFGKEELLEMTQKFSSVLLQTDTMTFETGNDRSPIAYWLVELQK